MADPEDFERQRPTVFDLPAMRRTVCDELGGKFKKGLGIYGWGRAGWWD
jgi:hypothetical protein